MKLEILATPQASQQCTRHPPSRYSMCGGLLALVAMLIAGAVYADDLDTAGAERFAALALDCVHKEYPNKISHVLNADEDARVPRELTPAFYGCFDWHSAVHGHWLLARLTNLYPDAAFSARALSALGKSLSEEHLIAELAYFNGEGRATFERPYGLAWLLQLGAELREHSSADAREWSRFLEPLEEAAADRLRVWLPKLSHAIRTGEHSQTAFAFGLALDWSRRAGDTDLERLLVDKARLLYGQDQACPLSYEPSGQDFLSPCIAEADFMRRVLAEKEYARWLAAFLPDIPTNGEGGWLAVAVVTDKSDGKLAHLDGLNLSRAWMLYGIASGLPRDDPRRPALLAAARQQSAAGLASVAGEDYAGGHWLASFATYLVTQRGRPTNLPCAGSGTWPCPGR